MQLSAILLSLTAATGAVAAGNWFKDCNTCRATGATTIQCGWCTFPAKNPGEGPWTEPGYVDIANCLRNKNGNLEWAGSNGGFTASCGSVEISSEGILSAKCSGGQQGLRASFDLKNGNIGPTAQGLACL